jgi:tetratricopeptide (TPR) repeat protein
LALLAKGETHKAIEALEHARELAPQDVDVLVQLSDVYGAQGDWDKALAPAKEAVRLAPTDGLANAALGRALLRHGQAQDARKAFEIAVKTYPDDPSIRLGLARALLRTGAHDKADAELEALAKKVPDAAPVWLEWATVRALKGDEPGAIERFDKAAELDPKLVSISVRRIGFLAEVGRCDAARQALAQWKKKRPPKDALAAAEDQVKKCKPRK